MKGRRLKITYRRNGEAEYTIDGVPVTKEESDREFPPREIGVPMMGHSPACWPMKSDAMAVHPKQIQEALARNAKHGITGVTYDPADGRAILADRGARRQLMALEGVHDKHGGYGDDHSGTSPLMREAPAEMAEV